MKITYIGNLSRESGGPAYSLLLALKAASSRGYQVRVLNEKLSSASIVPKMPFEIFYPEKMTAGHWRLAANFSQYIALVKDTEIFHIQGLWVGFYHQTALYARKHHIPYIISLRGMLYPQALKERSRWIKLMAFLLYQRYDLQHAACIQATCEEEIKIYRKLGFKNPVALIPNPIELPPQMPDFRPPLETFRIGYLGRLHPHKHIERLLAIQAFMETHNKMCELYIMGSGAPEYEHSLQNETKRLKLKNVHFTGFVSGAEKAKLLRACSITILPSESENFGNSVTESLKEGVPVIASKGTPWRQLEKYHCGWWVENDTDSLLKAVQQAMTADLPAMGKTGFRLLAEHYSLERHAEQLDSLYQWIAGSQEKPQWIQSGN